MAGVEDMIKQAEKSKNKPTVGTPNEITEWYAERNGKMFLNELWCNMGITFWAFHSGNYAAVCFGMDFAATTFHSQRFKDEGQWHDGAGGIHRGDIAFFTRPGVVGIGHIGLVHEVTPGNLITIEANTSDAVRFRTHPTSSGSIVGYGRPKYTEEDDMTKDELLDALESDRGQRALRAAVSHILRVAVGPDDGKTPAGFYFEGLRNDVKDIKSKVNQL